MLRRTITVLALLASCHSSTFAFSDEALCEAFKQISAESTKDIGTWIDANVRMDGIAVLCGLKIISFKKGVKITFDKLKPNWRENAQRGWNDIYCNDPFWKDAIVGGWTVAAAYTSPTGEHANIVAQCAP